MVQGGKSTRELREFSKLEESQTAIVLERHVFLHYTQCSQLHHGLVLKDLSSQVVSFTLNLSSSIDAFCT
jgi:hypothetical protein